MFVNFCIISVIMRGTKVKNGSCGLAECFSAPSALTQHPAGVLLSAAENYLHSTSTVGRDLFQLRFENETKTLKHSGHPWIMDSFIAMLAHYALRISDACKQRNKYFISGQIIVTTYQLANCQFPFFLLICGGWLLAGKKSR